MDYPHSTSMTPTPSANQSILSNIVGFSFVASLVQGFLTGRPVTGGAQSNYLSNTVQLFILGTIIESGRRFYKWLVQRFQFQYSITAEFAEGDTTYEWIILFLTEREVWKRSRQFRVSAPNSVRKWDVAFHDLANAIPLASGGTHSSTSKSSDAAYVPTYEDPQLFRWNGYWVEIKRSKSTSINYQRGGAQTTGTIHLTIYTRNMTVLPKLVQEARELYQSSSRPHVTIHTFTQNHMPHFSWSNSKRKAKRPLDSIILADGRMEDLLRDAKEFMEMESWYTTAGIPHRRGYLLHGPPGTGKTSTIYGLAGELGLEIYALSLASSMVDDSLLQRAADSIPKNSIFLIEDIDCAFPVPRSDDDDDDESNPTSQMMMARMGLGNSSWRSAVTLSGLLNVLDGVGSEEGKLFFATTNHIDHLDAALLRPGRIDVKIPYKLATPDQAAALFLRFYPESHTHIPEEALVEFSEKRSIISEISISSSPSPSPSHQSNLRLAYLTHLSNLFARNIPPNEFSTAELQGFLLSCKQRPLFAVISSSGWVEEERTYRREKEEREQKKKEKKRAKKQEDKGGSLRLRDGPAGVLRAGPGGLPISGDAIGSGNMGSSIARGPIPGPSMPGGSDTVSSPHQPVIVKEGQGITSDSPSVNHQGGTEKPSDLGQKVDGSCSLPGLEGGTEISGLAERSQS